ncbi:MAG: exosortase/archaeosortase family protein [Opitutaceae bacterium]|nr:exosortase/archaeosortase family protein [Opitutaceae bacterium]
MSDQSARSTSFGWVLPALASPLVFTAYDQSHWWSEKEDYGFGWLAPLFAAYVVRERWPSIKASLAEEAGARPAVPTMAIAWLTFLAGLTLFSIGAVYRGAAGPTFGGTLAITLGATTLLLVGVMIAASILQAPRPFRLAGYFLFPALVWLVSAPMLTVVENSLSTFLRAEITKVVFGFYDILGFSLEQRGNILILPSGQVGVEEACSGIRSLTGCLFAGSFLAATFAKNAASKAMLIAASLGFALLTNLLRSLFLTAWALAYGAQSIEGTIHDVSGYAVLGLTVVLLLLMVPMLDRREARGAVGSHA